MDTPLVPATILPEPEIAPYSAVPTLVEQTIQIFQTMRQGAVRAMQLLYETKESGAWEDRADTWGEFCEQDLGISQSYASKLLTTYQHYVIDGGIQPETLAGTDYERLYLARTLPGTPEEQATMAKTLSRREIKETKNEVNTHDHVFISLCKVCSIRMDEVRPAS